MVLPQPIVKLDAIQFPESEMRSLFGWAVTTKRATLLHQPFAPLAKDQLKALSKDGKRCQCARSDTHTAIMRAHLLQDGLTDSSY